MVLVLKFALIDVLVPLQIVRARLSNRAHQARTTIATAGSERALTDYPKW